MFETIIKKYHEQRTIILYGIIGMSAVMVDMGFFLVFYNIFDINPEWSTILSVSTAMIYAFALNSIYNFKTKDYIGRRFISYAFVSLAGMGISVLIIKFLVMLDVDANLAKAISLPPIVILQYFTNRYITFRSMKKNTSIHAVKDNFYNISTETNNTKKIAIIGGGFTGLTAAYTLAKLGHKVTVYEAQSVLGGLVAGFDLDGLPLEKAYHFLYKTDQSIINLAQEIGVGDKLHFHPSSVSLFYDNKIYPFMTPVDLLKFKPLSFINRIRAGVIALYLGKVTKWKKFAQVSAYDWMLKWGGKEVTRVIWEPVLRGKFFNYYDKISMSYLWSRVYVRANSKDRGDVTEKLGYFEGGFQTFTNRLIERCRDMGVTFHTNTKPTALIQKDNSATVMVNDLNITYDACLVTTPSYVFSSLINHSENSVSETYLKQLKSIEYLGAVLLVFTSDTKLTDYYWHNVNDLNQPFLVLLSLDALVGTENTQGKYVYYVGAYVPHDHKYFTMHDTDLIKLWSGGIKALFPNFTTDMMTNHRVFKFKNAQHIVEPNYEEKIPAYQTELPNFYLANFTQIFPDDRGTNYAVAEGIKVANLIDKNLKQ